MTQKNYKRHSILTVWAVVVPIVLLTASVPVVSSRRSAQAVQPPVEFSRKIQMLTTAAVGHLDPTFSDDGMLVDGRLVHSRDDANVVALQADGKLLVAGSGENYGGQIARYNPDGSLDATFGRGGWIAGCHARGMAIQADGKIVVGCSHYTGQSMDFLVARHNADGSIDTAFGSGGRVTTAMSSGHDFIESIAIQSDGKIVAAGSVDIDLSISDDRFAVARYNPDGTLDNTFDGDGKVITPVGVYSVNGDPGNSVAIQSDGKIVVAGGAYMGSGAGSNFVLIRYNINGSLDTSFESDGIVMTSPPGCGGYASSVTIQTDGRIVAAGTSCGFTLTRYNINGSLDGTFGVGGRVVTAIGSWPHARATSVAIRSDGKIVAAGLSYISTPSLTDTDLAVARYNSNGSLDLTFDGDGIATTPVNQGLSMINSVTVQPDGRIVGAGYTSPWFEGGGGSSSERDNFVLARYNENGSPDAAFGTGGIAITDFLYLSGGKLSDVAIQTDEKIVAIGRGLVRYNPDGTRDTTFGDGTGLADFRGNVVRIQADGKILFASGYSCTGDDDSLVATITRVDHKGSLDTSFGKQGTAELGCKDGAAGYTWFNSLAVQPDGKVVAAGGRYAPGGPDFVLARYNIDGSLDTTFGADGVAITEIGTAGAEAVAIQSDGKIVAAGGRYNASFSLARYNPDGSLDATFDGDGKVTTQIGEFSTATSVAIQSDGKIVTAGITTTGSNMDIAIVRYNPNGSLDASLDSDGIITAAVEADSDMRSSISLDGKGKLVVAGSSDGDFTLLRYNPNGSIDTTLGDDGRSVVDFNFSYDTAHGMALDNKGRAVIVGESNGAFAIARLLLTAPEVAISGRVLTPGGTGLRNATVTLTDSAGNRRTVLTSTLGFYSFDDIPAGETITITAVSRRYRFQPVTRTPNESLTNVDLVGLE